MKPGKKVPIGFIIGGVVIAMSSLAADGTTLIPRQVALIGGVALVIFGLSRLLFFQDSSEAQRKNRKIGWLVISILALATIGYVYLQDSKPNKKTYTKTYGSFQVTLNTQTCQGEAILEGDEVTFQIKGIPSNFKIDGFRLYNRNTEIEGKSIDMVCALLSDRRVIHCSTNLRLPEDNTYEFVDKGAYTIMYKMREPLADIKVTDLSFVILNDNTEPERIKIIEKW